MFIFTARTICDNTVADNDVICRHVLVDSTQSQIRRANLIKINILESNASLSVRRPSFTAFLIFFGFFLVIYQLIALNMHYS